MPRANINNLIKELKYARKLHLDELAFRIKEQKEAIKEKNFIIKLLKSEKSTTQNIKKAKKILKEWQKLHFFWINLVKKNRKWAKEGGSVSWHKKWIKLYQNILNYLK